MLSHINTMIDRSVPIGRLALALLFLVAGVQKAMNPTGAAGYITSVGLPEWLVWPTILFEIGAGVLLAIGLQARAVAVLLALFTLAAALIFHTAFAEPGQLTQLLKNLAIAGGLLAIARNASPITLQVARSRELA